MGSSISRPMSHSLRSSNIQATSTMQDYNIGVYIYGTADDPKTVFSSEPPLPQEDIIALLATGATASQLTARRRRRTGWKGCVAALPAALPQGLQAKGAFGK